MQEVIAERPKSGDSEFNLASNAQFHIRHLFLPYFSSNVFQIYLNINVFIVNIS